VPRPHRPSVVTSVRSRRHAAMDDVAGALSQNHHQHSQASDPKLQNENLVLVPTAALGVPEPMMPTVPLIPAPPATVPVSVVAVLGIRVVCRSAQIENFHDPHIFPSSLFAPGNPSPRKIVHTFLCLK
jgi:hypothetical protein